MRKLNDYSQKHMTFEIRPNGSRRIATINEEPTETQQQFKEECDINNIMKKYGNDPVAFQALTRPGGKFADFSEIQDYQGMLQTVFEAQSAFNSLPAEMRLRFRNDPSYLLDFIQDPKNYAEGIQMGLLVPKPDFARKNNDDSNDDKPTQSKKTNPKKPATPLESLE